MADLAIKPFDRRARRLKIDDDQLCEAANRVRDGQADAALGQGLFKQRIGRTGAGKSRGFRVLLCIRHDQTAIFLTAFAKKKQENLSHEELTGFQSLSAEYRALSTADLATAVRGGTFREIECTQEGDEDDLTDTAE